MMMVQRKVYHLSSKPQRIYSWRYANKCLAGAKPIERCKFATFKPPSLQRSEYVTIGTQVSNAHRGNSYLSIVRRGATQLEYNGCKFPVINIDRDKKYTFSMFTRIFGEDKPYLEVKT